MSRYLLAMLLVVMMALQMVVLQFCEVALRHLGREALCLWKVEAVILVLLVVSVYRPGQATDRVTGLISVFRPVRLLTHRLQVVVYLLLQASLRVKAAQ
jgi:hypothetical protein